MVPRADRRVRCRAVQENRDFAADLTRSDLGQANIARVYDYMLGGSANFAVDRSVAEEGVRLFPQARAYAQANRAFLGRAVRTLVTEYGLDQFLDLGSGIPTVGNVHEIAHRYNPHARIAYVDWETIAVHHARRMLGPTEHRVTMTQADIRDPDAVLSAPGVGGLLDFTRPIAVLALGVLEILPDNDGAALVAHYRDACVAGSTLAVSNETQLDATDAEIDGLRATFALTTTPDVHLRDRGEVAELLPGYELLEPGVVPAPWWRPEHDIPTAQARRANVYAAAGLLPPAGQT